MAVLCVRLTWLGFAAAHLAFLLRLAATGPMDYSSITTWWRLFALLGTVIYSSAEAAGIGPLTRFSGSLNLH